MIESVEIVDNTNTPIGYLPELENFRNGVKFEFKPGVNIIIGENGSGKTTLMNLIRAYLMVNVRTIGRGLFNTVLSKCHRGGLDCEGFTDGAIVKADYGRQVFNYTKIDSGIDADVTASDEAIGLGEVLSQHMLSTGQSNNSMLAGMFDAAFKLPKSKLRFDYRTVMDYYGYKDRMKYIEDNTIEGDEYTFLIDEPDASIDINGIMDLYSIFSFHKDECQIIAVLHNPLLISSLSRLDNVNFIEMSAGYRSKVDVSVDTILGLNNKK